jgi:hypothetical protein
MCMCSDTTIYGVLILIYICPHNTICVSSYYYMWCPHTTTCGVLIVLYSCPHTTICVSSYYYMCPHTTICVLILLYVVSSYYYMCPHATTCGVLMLLCVLMLLYMWCPHTTTGETLTRLEVYVYTCVLILPYIRPYATTYVSAYYYVSSYYFTCYIRVLVFFFCLNPSPSLHATDLLRARTSSRVTLTAGTSNNHPQLVITTCNRREQARASR